MTVKIWIIVIFLVITAIKLLLQLVQYRSAANPISENVSDVYDSETYLKWQKYHGELSRLEVIENLTSTLIMTLLLVFDVFASVAALFGSGFFALTFSVVIFEGIVESIASIPFSYISTMKIEEKYGFNRTTMKTFVRDRIIGFIVGTGLSCFFVCAIRLSHYYLGNAMAILLSAVLCLFVLVANLVFPLLSRVQNKFVPLEEGSLRDKLTSLLERHGYHVKAIEVMDASRRTTKSNAYFSGFGKEKRIVLYDNLVNSMDENEICAVFAHELGHGLHHDIPKLLLMSCFNMILTALLAWFTVATPEICTAFGFENVNYGFAFIVLNIAILPFLMQLTGLITNAVSRSAEYKADAQAYNEGYADALISGLKKLSRDNFSHLSPSRLLVALDYNHPPLSERISAIERLKNK